MISAMGAASRATCARLQLGQLAKNRGVVGSLFGKSEPLVLATWGVRQTSIATNTRSSSSSSSVSSAAKYNLPKLSKEEVMDLENKISSYGKSPSENAQQQTNSSAQTTATSSMSNEADAIQLTDSAVKRLKHLSEKRKKTQYLRLRVDSGGCYGFSYMLDMTEEPEANDVVLDRKGAKVVVDDCSLPLVRGATIDWQDRLIGQAFLVVANPNSSGGCGCGASFEIKLD
ncbi:[4Fe-4S] proteins maturation [Coemansia sp. RSA 1286]|nr:[4Fe-4S] proteins maturation [Coemansia sp. RSA 485]KAJ2602672.1 [4Fe-4S] proteins maturation [Coemansia sp. RSA 1721]KAJ2640276.1 [4Fe-4S] proteins maturation [Coemansia sp. RSA 1286]